MKSKTAELDQLYLSMRDVTPATWTTEQRVYWMWRMQSAVPRQTLTQVREFLAEKRVP